jgi:hypothetical protein
MSDLTKEEVQSLLKIERKIGTFDLFVEGFGRSIEVSIALNSNSRTLTDRTIQTVNEVANLTRAHCEYILRLLFNDAMAWKAEAFSSDPPPPPQRGPMNWLRRIFKGPGVVELSIDDPRQPLFGIDTPAGIEAIIKWKYIFIDDSQETSKRVATGLLSLFFARISALQELKFNRKSNPDDVGTIDD